jgi:uncharacterized membrane protein YphA (DoxX/SURF4 family)
MDKLATLARIGRVFFGLSLVAFGIQNVLYGDFVPGRAPAWPASMPGRLAWAWVSALVLVAAGLAIVVERKVRPAALTVAAMIFVWAALRHVPLAASDHGYGLAWTNLGKALALSGGALVVAALSPRWSVLGRIFFAAFLVSSGIQHFLFTEFVMTLVPGWIPGARFWTDFAGVALIAGGLGLLVPRVARPAAALCGLMIFLWLVMLHVPRALAAAGPMRRNEWTAVAEALAMSGIALALARGFEGPRPAGRVGGGEP